MTEVDFDDFKDWAVERFGYDNVTCRGGEVCVNSPFVPDYDPDNGHHLQCNPAKNAYHCFKSGEHGNLYRLVQDFDGCTFPEAVDLLSGGRRLHQMEAKMAQFFSENRPPLPAARPAGLELPPHTFPITSLGSESPYRRRAEDYLSGRGLSAEGLFYCTEGRYRGRVLIPYYGPDGRLIYFNARDITGASKVRYLGPPRTCGVGKADVLWVSEWPPAGSTLYLTEGEFDAMSLRKADLHGAAVGGKNFSDRQMRLVAPYHLAICFDLDKYGQEALHKIGAFVRSSSGFDRRVSYVRPAGGFKDWNEMLAKIGAGALHFYVKTYERPLGFDDLVKMNLQGAS